jgi:anti-anti-sigma factor
MEDQLLKLEIQNHPHLTVLRCSGRIVHGDGADTLLRTAMSQENSDLQIDLCDVDAIDASGLGVLARLEKWAKEGNRTVQVINPTGLVREAIEATHLNSVLQVSPPTEEKNAAA